VFFEVVRKKFSKILAVILVIVVDILQEVDHPVSKVDFMALAAPHH